MLQRHRLAPGCLVPAVTEFLLEADVERAWVRLGAPCAAGFKNLACAWWPKG